MCLHAYKCYRAQPRGPDILFPCRCSICIHIVLVRYIQAGRPKNGIVFGPAFVTRLLTPRSQKSGYGLLLGCRSGREWEPFENTFFGKVRTQINRENLHSLFWSSIGRGRNSREGALDHRESRERRDKIIAAKTENAKKIKKKWTSKINQNRFQRRGEF